jgi:hypothetical protein
MAQGFSLKKRALPNSQDSLSDLLLRTDGIPYRNLLGLLLGYTASTLLLSSGALNPSGAAWIFVVALVVTLLFLVLIRPYLEKVGERFAWGLLVITILGFGLGSLIHGYRAWWKWLWYQYLRINEPHELLLEALFLLGVILGVFVVRNWAKEQKAFVESLTGVLGGTFVATVLGKVQEGLTPLRALAYYALGFTMSAVVNLIAAARLTANYTNKRSISSRAILDYLYGSERAKTIDGYFLKNFLESPDYAKQRLIDTLMEYRRLVMREFAELMEKRRKDREKDRDQFISELAETNKTIEKLRIRRRKLAPACSKLKAAEDKSVELRDEQDAISSVPEPRPPKQEKRLQEIDREITELARKIEQLKDKCTTEQLAEWLDMDQQLKQLKPSYFYELIAIEGEEEGEDLEEPTRKITEPEYSIIYRQIGSNQITSVDEVSDAAAEGADSDRITAIHRDMFRVGITIKWQDVLEYIIAPGEYRVSFPYNASVAGLALLTRQTIIMDRDRNIKYRAKDYKEGISASDREQARGLDEINYLSYISIPIVSHLGSPEENPIGVVNIDTKLFVTPSRLDGQPVRASKGVFRIRLTKTELTQFASNLYERDDRDVKYIEGLTRIIVPVMELYSKCRIGAI